MPGRVPAGPGRKRGTQEARSHHSSSQGYFRPGLCFCEAEAERGMEAAGLSTPSRVICTPLRLGGAFDAHGRSGHRWRKAGILQPGRS